MNATINVMYKNTESVLFKMGEINYCALLVMSLID